jgi:predicted amidohydrolase YtcJ
LNAIASVREEGSEQDYTLTHVEFVNHADLDRFKTLGVTADFQLGSDHVLHEENKTATRLLGTYNYRLPIPINELYQQGANVSLSSDWNVNPLSPLAAIANAVSMGKPGSNRGLTSTTAAIDAYTINPAKSLGLDSITGSIEIGKSADFAILSKDIVKLSPQQIKKTEVLMTILQGEIVYNAKTD